MKLRNVIAALAIVSCFIAGPLAAETKKDKEKAKSECCVKAEKAGKKCCCAETAKYSKHGSECGSVDVKK